MTAWIIIHSPDDFEAEPAVKIGRLEVVSFQDDLAAFARRGLHFNHAHQAATMSLMAQGRRNVEMTDVASRTPRPPVYSAYDGACVVSQEHGE